MFKVKVKPPSKKVQEHNVGQVMMVSHSEATHILDNVIEQPEVKKNKVKTPAKKVVYISKYGSKAIFDSINLCAKIFGKDTATVRYRIEHPKVKTSANYDWLEGGRLEYYNN